MAYNWNRAALECKYLTFWIESFCTVPGEVFKHYKVENFSRQQLKRRQSHVIISYCLLAKSKGRNSEN